MTLTQEKKQSAGQLKLLTRMIGDIAESDQVQDALKALDKDGSERLKGHPEFVKSLREFTIKRIRELTNKNKFATEEKWSNFGYTSGYKRIKRNASFEEVLRDLNKQAESISRLFGIKHSFDVEYARKAWTNLPAGAEKIFLIPRWEKIAPTYNEAVQKMFRLIEQTRGGKFRNGLEGKLGLDHLRQTTKTAGVFQKLGDEQKGYNSLVVSAQFGIRHRGRSVRRACEVFTFNEFGLGLFAVVIMILTHPERLQHYRDLWIDCVGDEFSSDGGEFSAAPSVYFNDKEVEIGENLNVAACALYGAVSGFLLQT